MYRFRLARPHYEDAILVVLDRLGGRGGAREVQEGVRRELDRFMTEVDLGAVPSNAREVRWRNDTRWARNQLVYQGLLQAVADAGWGVWSLTPEGRAAAVQAGVRLGSAAPRERRLADDARAVGVPLGAGRQLTFLAEVFRRAHETPLGGHSHPALHDVVAMLESLLHGPPPPAPVGQPSTHSRLPQARVESKTWRPPLPTATVTPNHLDPKRMRSFVEGPWQEAVSATQRLPAEQKRARTEEIDLLASLPAVTCLVAVRSGWMDLASGATLASRCLHRVMTDGLKTGGLVGGLSLEAPDVAAVLREGLFHRTLTGWVQHLDEREDDTLALRVMPLRTWLTELRTQLGEPTGAGPRRADPLWAWLFEQDPTYEPPRDGSVEEAAAALTAWLGGTEHGAQDAPARGALLWHALLGWSIALGTSRNRFDPNFGAHILVTAEDKSFKYLSKTGWVDVDRATAAAGCPEVMREAARRVGAVARRDWGG